jgi:hypothetical protein
MRKNPARERPRRGAWWGSRRATAVAAACVAAVSVTLSLPAPAGAFICGTKDGVSQTTIVSPRQLQATQKIQKGVDDCTAPGNRPHPRVSKRKKGSMSGLTVFVLAVAAALLIPIGRNGIPRAVDPFGHDRSFIGDEA